MEIEVMIIHTEGQAAEQQLQRPHPTPSGEQYEPI